MPITDAALAAYTYYGLSAARAARAGGQREVICADWDQLDAALTESRFYRGQCLPERFCRRWPPCRSDLSDDEVGREALLERMPPAGAKGRGRTGK